MTGAGGGRPGAAARDARLPAEFSDAVATLRTVRARPEIILEEISPPQRLAPYSYALGADVTLRDLDIGTGRLVVLYDPDGQDGWDGVLRVVGFLTAESEPALATDDLFAEVGWSWLVEALDRRGAEHTALGGTVTSTFSTRFGDIAGPQHTVDVEVRCSWTARSSDLAPHLEAWLDLVGSACGLPPPGVRMLSAERFPADAGRPGPR